MAAMGHVTCAVVSAGVTVTTGAGRLVARWVEKASVALDAEFTLVDEGVNVTVTRYAVAGVSPGNCTPVAPVFNVVGAVTAWPEAVVSWTVMPATAVGAATLMDTVASTAVVVTVSPGTDRGLIAATAVSVERSNPKATSTKRMSFVFMV